jgi:outer membrane protein, heavy metal efflux system
MQGLFRRAGLALAVVFVLGGCAASMPRPDSKDIDALLIERGGQAVPTAGTSDSATRIAALRTKSMSADGAVEYAMLHSPALQMEYARLGIARADVLAAIQIGNPRFSISRLRPSSGAGSQLTTALAMPIVDLLLLPARARLANADYQRTRFEIAAAILGVANDVRAAWYTYVGAQQVADMRMAVARAAETSAELAKRFYDAGNISELQLRQEQASASEARIAAAHAQAQALRARLALNTIVGLVGSDADWKTDDRLPQPLPQDENAEALVAQAHRSNLELLAARQELDVAESVLASSHLGRWLGGSEVGVEREREVDGSHIQGPTLALEIPIFNQGQARQARAEAMLAQAKAHLAQAELRTDNAVRLDAERVRILRQVVAIHRDALIPQRENVVARSQEQQNFMLIGVFELIQAKVKEFDAYQGYLEAVRDYWVARVELARAVGQALPGDSDATALTPATSEITDSTHDHVQAPADHEHEQSTEPEHQPPAEQEPEHEHEHQHESGEQP